MATHNDYHKLRATALKEMVIAVFIVCLAVTFWFAIFPTWITGPKEDAYFARLVTVCIGIIGVGLLLQSVVGWLKLRSNSPKRQTTPPNTFSWNWRFIGILFIWAIDIFYMEVVGFYILSPLAIACSLWLLHVRGLRKIAMWSLLPLPVIYIVFGMLLKVSLPGGLLY